MTEVSEFPPGRALDVGCGEGADAVWLAKRGWDVTGLDVSGVPKEIVAIMQGVIVLSVVVAYELVRRYRVRLEQREVGQALGTTKVPEEVGA